MLLGSEENRDILLNIGAGAHNTYFLIIQIILVEP